MVRTAESKPPCTTCPNCSPGKRCTEFQKILAFKNLGLSVYKQNIVKSKVLDISSPPPTLKENANNIFILHNTSETEITSADIIPAFDFKELGCERCRHIAKHARKLLQNVDIIDKYGIRGICDHCRTQQQSRSICVECREAVKKYAADKGMRPEDVIKPLTKIKADKAYWLCEMPSDQAKPTKPRTVSELNMAQLLHRSTEAVRQFRVEQLFQSKPRRLFKTKSLSDIATMTNEEFTSFVREVDKMKVSETEEDLFQQIFQVAKQTPGSPSILEDKSFEAQLAHKKKDSLERPDTVTFREPEKIVTAAKTTAISDIDEISDEHLATLIRNKVEALRKKKPEIMDQQSSEITEKDTASLYYKVGKEKADTHPRVHVDYSDQEYDALLSKESSAYEKKPKASTLSQDLASEIRKKMDMLKKVKLESLKLSHLPEYADVKKSKSFITKGAEVISNKKKSKTFFKHDRDERSETGAIIDPDRDDIFDTKRSFITKDHDKARPLGVQKLPLDFQKFLKPVDADRVPFDRKSKSFIAEGREKGRHLDAQQATKLVDSDRAPFHRKIKSTDDRDISRPLNLLKPFKEGHDKGQPFDAQKSVKPEDSSRAPLDHKSKSSAADDRRKSTPLATEKSLRFVDMGRAPVDRQQGDDSPNSDKSKKSSILSTPRKSKKSKLDSEQSTEKLKHPLRKMKSMHAKSVFRYDFLQESGEDIAKHVSSAQLITDLKKKKVEEQTAKLELNQKEIDIQGKKEKEKREKEKSEKEKFEKEKSEKEKSEKAKSEKEIIEKEKREKEKIVTEKYDVGKTVAGTDRDEMPKTDITKQDIVKTKERKDVNTKAREDNIIPKKRKEHQIAQPKREVTKAIQTVPIKTDKEHQQELRPRHDVEIQKNKKDENMASKEKNQKSTQTLPKPKDKEITEPDEPKPKSEKEELNHLELQRQKEAKRKEKEKEEAERLEREEREWEEAQHREKETRDKLQKEAEENRNKKEQVKTPIKSKPKKINLEDEEEIKKPSTKKKHEKGKSKSQDKLPGSLSEDEGETEEVKMRLVDVAKQSKKGTVKTGHGEYAELPFRTIRISKPSTDDLIMKLVKVKQNEQKPAGDVSVSNIADILQKRHKAHKFKKSGVCLMCTDSDLELDLESLLAKQRMIKPEGIDDIIIGNEIYSDPAEIIALKEEKLKEVKTPKLFETKLKVVNIADKPKEPVEDKEDLKSKDTKEADESKGIIRYRLSDRDFIDKGWTLLPTEKVVRKMNVYRMRPSRPEFDWFERNKNKKIMLYDSGEKMADFDDSGRSRWYYKNGKIALDYYDAEEMNAQQRYVVYSSGEPDERGRSRPITVLATFDYLGNGVVFDHKGKIRLKYNQTEGVVLDREIGPVSHWKWHSLNDPPILQQVMMDTKMTYKDPDIELLGENEPEKRPDYSDSEMLAVEFDNYVKERGTAATSRKFQPYQIRMKALKINENFSLRVIDQATIYLIYRDGSTNIKLNLGMILDEHEIIDTDVSDVGATVTNNLDHFPARSDSVAGIQRSIEYVRRFERARTERDRRLRPPAPTESADRLVAATSRPLRPPLNTVPNDENCYCKRRTPPNNLYYDTRFA